MNNYPKGGIIGRCIYLWQKLSDLRIPVHASSACYFLALSLFPALVLLLGLLRYANLDVLTLAEGLVGIIPEALLPYAEDLIFNTYDNTSRTIVSVSAVTALWSASRGIHGLLTGLNAVYGVTEGRSYVSTRLISVGYTFAFLIVLVLTLVLQVFGTAIADRLSADPSLFVQFLDEVIDLRFFVLLLLQTALFTAMFMVFPNRRNGCMESLPGAVLASLGWLIFSNLFSIYVEHFSGYADIYGPVYTAALSMLWLYFCICLVFYGGALNRYLSRGFS